MTSDYIQGNKFKSLARFIYAPPRGKGLETENLFPPNDYRYLVSTLDKRLLIDGDIIFTTSFYADYLFTQDISNRYILITHNSDTTIDFAPPDNVIMWFTTNINIRHPKIKSIPIGLENDIWFPYKKDKMRRKVTQKKNFKNLIYCNHNIKTNPKKRQKPYDVLSGNKWVTFSKGMNGQGFDVYLDNIYNHPFVVCPEGNGIDTHRVWECLYISTIPVMIRNINNQFYQDLPILFIDDWEEINEKFLHDAYMRIVDTRWNIEKLTFNWWRNEIMAIR